MSVKSVVQKGMGENARLVMVMHPVAEGRFRRAVEEISKLDLMRAPPRSIRVIEEEFVVVMPSAAVRDRVPLIERYRDRLPLEPGDPVVTR